MKTVLKLLLAFLFFLWLLWLSFSFFAKPAGENLPAEKEQNQKNNALKENPASPPPAAMLKIEEEIKEQNKKTEKEQKVPFTSQAPLGEWSDQRQQDGCEEAAALMAIFWARGENLNQDQAKKEILAISSYQSENFGEYRDTSAADTLKIIIKGYFHYEQAYLKESTNLKDIIAEINQGHLVIAPTNGRLLNNPFYTPPGPERHNLLIHGYDRGKDEFITNDPGTRRGENYRYKTALLFAALRDYPTGDHLPIPEKEAKNIIVIKKE